jgi:hypothetical protein
MNLNTKLLCAGSLILLAGCQSGEIYLSPPLNTRVLDEKTKLGIQGVRVSMRSVVVGSPLAEGTTSSDGHIFLPRIKGRVSIGFPFTNDIVLPLSVVDFKKEGCEPVEIKSDTGLDYFQGIKSIELVCHNQP